MKLGANKLRAASAALVFKSEANETATINKAKN